MKKFALLAFLMIGAFVCGNILCEDTDEDDRDTIVGTVKTEKDSSGKIVKITVNCVNKYEDEQDEVVIYFVTLDPKGLDLGGKLNGKEAEVVGIITRKEKGDDAELWIKVMSFEEAKAEDSSKE